MSRRTNGNGAAAVPARRCAIYTRKSTAHGLEQEFNSLDAQYEACLAYIQAQPGWAAIPERYDDGGWSGGNIERPAFQRLLRDIEAGKIDIVVTYKVDRLSRSLLDFAHIMDDFQRAGVSFVSVTQNFSTADAMGRLTLNMLMSFAEFEREMARERTRDKIAAARRKGKWTGGPTPMGFDVVDKRLVINEVEAAVIQDVFTLYEHHGSALAVAHALNDQGRTTKERSRKGAQRWTKVAVLRVLKNPVYAGYMRCGEELHDGEHEAIITREQFARVQALLEDHGGQKIDRGRNPDYLLRGLLRCGLCGKAMTPASTRGRGGREYRYYRCISKDQGGRKACSARPLPAPAIESFVIDRIREATADGTLADDIVSRLEERAARQRQLLMAERRSLPGHIARLSSEGANLASSLATVSGTARKLLEAKIEDLGQQLGRYEARLAEVEEALANLDTAEADARWVADAITNFNGIWELMTTENKGRLIRALVHEVVVDEPAGEVTATLLDLGIDDADESPEPASSMEA